MIVLTSRLGESYGDSSSPESPERLRNTYELLARNKWVNMVLTERYASEQDLLKVHSSDHLSRLKDSIQEDPDCPTYPEMYKYASLAAGIALEAAKKTTEGNNSFSLMRPPGHHAAKGRSMGFCYINNAALAAVFLRNQGISKVAILDIDNHHGNGTEEIVNGLEGILFVDLHKHPDYPGTGKSSHHNAINFQLPNNIGEEGYLSVLDTALTKITEFNPQFLVVSIGFDTFEKDIIGGLGLKVSSYSRIGSRLRSLKIPSCSLMEGGYNLEALPKCVLSYISSMQ